MRLIYRHVIHFMQCTLIPWEISMECFTLDLLGGLSSLIIIGLIVNGKKGQKELNKKATFVLIGYISFLLPMAITVVIDFSTSSAVPEHYVQICYVTCNYIANIFISIRKEN